jgi:hypothetical protein
MEAYQNNRIIEHSENEVKLFLFTYNAGFSSSLELTNQFVT